MVLACIVGCLTESMTNEKLTNKQFQFGNSMKSGACENVGGQPGSCDVTSAQHDSHQGNPPERQGAEGAHSL